jgi:phosphoglycerate kinase
MSIVGGAKLSTKVNLLKNLVKKVDKLALGGGIAGAFLAFQGNTSLKIAAQKEFEEVIEIVGKAKECGCKLIFPVDFSALMSENNENSIITVDGLNASIFDIGPESVKLFLRHIRESATILWNGPVGLFEKTPFDFGTRSIGEEIARLTREGRIVSIVGGGDTGFAMNKFGFSKDLTYQSTSGGALLAYLEGNKLPGLMAMKDAFSLQE